MLRWIFVYKDGCRSCDWRVGGRCAPWLPCPAPGASRRRTPLCGGGTGSRSTCAVLNYTKLLLLQVTERMQTGLAEVLATRRLQYLSHISFINPVPAKKVAALLELVRRSDTIACLDISNSKLAEVGWRPLSSLVSRLITCKLNNCRLKTKQVNETLKFICEEGSKTRTLELNSNDLRGVDRDLLGRSVNVLTTLRCSQANLSGKQVKTIFDHLESESATLKHLDINTEGAYAYAPFSASVVAKLVSLNIWGWQAGVSPVLQALHTFRTPDNQYSFSKLNLGATNLSNYQPMLLADFICKGRFQNKSSHEGFLYT